MFLRLPTLLVEALSLLTYLSFTSAQSYTSDVDVAIIGAGFSGLAAANAISAAGKSFVVLEARDRVGGRVLNVKAPSGETVEVGATFVGPTQDRVLAYVDELGLELEATYDTGESFLYINGVGTRYNAAEGFPVDEETLGTVLNGMALLESMAAGIDTTQPWTHVNASLWDSVTFQTWIDANIPGLDAQFFFEVFDSSVFSTEPKEISLLYVVSYIAAAGNETSPGSIARLIGTTGGGQESRIAGGTQRIAIALAEKLGSENIFLKQPVRRIEQSEGGYTITTENGVSFNAKQVVVAMAPPMASRIDYSPLLPAGRDQLTQRMPMGSIGKAIAIYETPFWRADGLNGQVLSDTGIVRATYDISPPNGSYGVMMGFIEADQMRQYDDASVEEIKAGALEDYRRYFGPAAANIKSWVVQRWDNEEYSRGGPVAFAPPGVLTQYGPFIAGSFEGIHFAGTESGKYWTGYMDGAIRSGERVAKEVLASL